jgi:hypothetical protein
MRNINKIFSYIQMLVIVCLMAMSEDQGRIFFSKSENFPCVAHQCGCKTEADCKAHCCCSSHKDRNEFQNISEKHESFRVFISSLNCKRGNNAFTSTTFQGKYVLANKIQPTTESFLCFLISNTLIPSPEIRASPIEKPPRYFI